MVCCIEALIFDVLGRLLPSLFDLVSKKPQQFELLRLVVLSDPGAYEALVPDSQRIKRLMIERLSRELAVAISRRVGIYIERANMC